MPVNAVRSRLLWSQALLQFRDLGVATIEAQSLGQGQLAADEAREQLASAWREYVDRFGPINRYREVWRTPSPRAHQQAVKAAEDAWRAELTDDGDVGCHVVAVSAEVRDYMVTGW